MRNLSVVLALLLSLTGCSYLTVHKMDIEQGNIITPEMANQIHRGMTVAQVKEIAGDPVLSNVFDANRVDYVYTMQTGSGERTEKHITLIFRNGLVSEIQGNMYSQFIR